MLEAHKVGQPGGRIGNAWQVRKNSRIERLMIVRCVVSQFVEVQHLETKLVVLVHPKEIAFMLTKRPSILFSIPLLFGIALETEAQSIFLHTDPWIVWASMHDIELKQQHLREIASTFYRAGDKKQALQILRANNEIAKKIDNPSQRAWTLVDIALKTSETGEKKATLTLLVRAMESAKEIDDKLFEACWLERIGDALVETGHKEQALQAFNQALDAAQNIIHPVAKLDALARITSAMAGYQDAHRALALLKDAANTTSFRDTTFGRHASVLTRVARAFVATGDKRRALSTARQVFELTSQEVTVISRPPEGLPQKESAVPLLVPLPDPGR